MAALYEKSEKRLASSIAVQAYVRRAKAVCLCSYCGKKKRRLGRVEIATLRVGTRAKEGKRGGGGKKKISQSRLDS